MRYRVVAVLGLLAVAGCNDVLGIRQPADALLEPDAGAKLEAATSQTPSMPPQRDDESRSDEDAGDDENAGR